ncbi:MAG: cupin-like domain-containing protein [Pseudomonadaceae bacterium]|nr:cupin-like domain-containing protein [Pseudomonadaceae bacterium]
MIDRTEKLSFNDFARNYLKPMTPVVMTNGVSEWPAVGKWTPEYLRDTIAPKVIELRPNQSGQTTYRFPDHMETFLAAERDGTVPPYLTNANIYRFFPELISDVEPYLPYALPDLSASPFLPKDFLYEKFQLEILLGAAGNGFSVLHADKHHMNAFIAQIYGEKEFIIFPPDQARFLYPRLAQPLLSDVDDIWNPDLERYPDLEHTTPIRVTLKPGDLLFVPGNWWHTTRMEQTSIGVTCNSVSASNWRAFASDGARLMAQTKPLKAKMLKLYMAAMTLPVRWSVRNQRRGNLPHCTPSLKDPRARSVASA